MGILRSKFNVSRGNKAAAEPTEAASEETSRKPPVTSPQKAAKRQKGRKRAKGQMTLADLAATTAEIVSKPPAGADGETTDPTEAQLSALAQVRDLIAGPQLSDYSHRIAELESAAREQAALTAQLREAITALERNTTALAERCDTEAANRDALAEEMRTHLTKLGGVIVAGEDRLRSETVAQGKVLTDLVHQRSGELSDELRTGLERLSNEKASRAAIASLLVTAARSLDDEEPSE